MPITELHNVLVVGALTFAWVLPVQAQGDLCDLAALRAATETGVPKDVLLALTRTETGRSRGGKLQPWPWTVNLQGKGYWFATKTEALAFATLHHDAGARSFDVGCFQVNFKWHGQAFQSISDMFDPDTNAFYAASFLKDLKQGRGDWSEAAGAYHSKTPELKARYQARFEDIYAVARSESLTPKITKPLRINNFPLLKQTGKTGRMGSLFGGQSLKQQPLFDGEAKS